MFSPICPAAFLLGRMAMCVIRFITSLLMSVVLFFGSLSPLFGGVSSVKYIIDTSDLGDEIPNIVDNVNVWDMGTQFYEPQRNSENDVMEFVRYIQLMQCTGGTPERDLFIDPFDKSTFTDYDFEPLIKNCRGILSLGAKPHLKLGGVPIKFTSGYIIGGDFSMNIYPPDDYEVYYGYIKAIITALVDEFGIDEVRSWRFGCMTEFENGGWFQAKSGDPEDSMIAYCKLYDYTVQALVDVLGEDITVGAHSMAVTEGLWDERDFIRHVAKGTNYANGKKGTKISFISASFYDNRPGKYTKGMTLPETVKHLKKTAEKYGLKDLFYGIDEGRILFGNNYGKADNQLLLRITGYTWQAAYDARLFTQGINSGLDYFSSWGFLSNGLFDGNPTVSYHVASNISKFAGSRQTNVISAKVRAGIGIESECLSGWDSETNTLRIMTYNYKNDVGYSKKMNVSFTLKVPQITKDEVTVVRYLISDDCNYFDEFQEDRVKYSITDDCFNWSPDDPCIDSPGTLSDETARTIYFNELKDKYAECSVLTPVYSTAKVENGRIRLDDTLDGSNVIFYEIY